LKNKSSPGVDGISTSMIKKTYMNYLNKLTDIINLSIVKGKFPSMFKHSVVIPIPKKPNCKNIDQFRPISLLPVFPRF